jgi:hypothetical protein
MSQNEYRIEITKTRKLMPEKYPNMLAAMTRAKFLAVEKMCNIAVVKIVDDKRILLATYIIGD